MKRFIVVACFGVLLASVSSSCAQPRYFGGGYGFRSVPPRAYFGPPPGAFIAPPRAVFAPRPRFFAPRPWGWGGGGGWRRGGRWGC